MRYNLTVDDSVAQAIDLIALNRKSSPLEIIRSIVSDYCLPPLKLAKNKFTILEPICMSGYLLKSSGLNIFLDCQKIIFNDSVEIKNAIEIPDNILSLFVDIDNNLTKFPCKPGSFTALLLDNTKCLLCLMPNGVCSPSEDTLKCKEKKNFIVNNEILTKLFKLP